MGWGERQIKCGVCEAWVNLPDDFFPDDPRNVIYRALPCPKCGNLTMLCYTPGSGPAVIDSASTYLAGSEPFGYVFSPFPMGIIPISLDDVVEMEREMKKNRKRTKRNKRRWKIIYKGKLGEDARHSGQPPSTRKTKKNL